MLTREDDLEAVALPAGQRSVLDQEEQDIDSELLVLQRENDHLKLYLASLTRLLIGKGILNKAEIEKMVDIIDAEDGAIDGKARGEIL